MELEEALKIIKKAILRIKEYDSGKVENDLIVEGKNYKGWYIQAFKNKEIDVKFFTGWIKINNIVEEFMEANKMETINGLNKVLQDLEDE